MADIMTFLRTYNYTVCLATGKLWTLIEAADYFAAYLAGKESWPAREDAYQGFMAIRDQLLSAMKQNIHEGSLIVDEVFLERPGDGAEMHRDELDAEQTTVRPFTAIDWALANTIPVPREFAKYHSLKKNNKSAYPEILAVKKSTVHHERCRAVAALLWSIDPEIPIAEMACRSEIIQFGCEGQQYDMRTVSRWLASLKADRRPGQPRKKKD